MKFEVPAVGAGRSVGVPQTLYPVPLGYPSTGVSLKDTPVSRIQTLSAGVRPPLLRKYGIVYVVIYSLPIQVLKYGIYAYVSHVRKLYVDKRWMLCGKHRVSAMGTTKCDIVPRPQRISLRWPSSLRQILHFGFNRNT